MKLIIIILTLISFYVFSESVKMQKNDILLHAKNMHLEFENNFRGGITAVKYLKTTATQYLKHKHLDLYYINFLKVRKSGEYYLDLNNSALQNNTKFLFSGFGGITKEHNTLQEIEMSISIVPFFKLIKEENKMYTWVYYLSSNGFLSLYPYANNFKLTPESMQEPYYIEQTPKNNPRKEFKLSPLYKDPISKNIMVTLSEPIYFENKFLGIIGLDLPIKSQNKFLKRIDTLDNNIFIYNDKLEIIGSNIKEIEDNKIQKVSSFLSKDIYSIKDTHNHLESIKNKYIYKSSFKDIPLHFIYSVDKKSIILSSVINTLPIIFVIFILYFINKSSQNERRLKEEINQRKQKELELLATVDPLTSLYNRRKFDDILKISYNNAKRNDSSIGILFMDIDYFKFYNDNYGHAKGDECLIEVAKVLKDTVKRSTDYVARYGGEEFVIILINPNYDTMKILSKNILNAIKEKNIEHKYSKVANYVTLSIGGSLVDFSKNINKNISMQELVKIADDMMYEVKESGRNSFKIKEL